jgi:hypothetical protein
MKPLVLSSFCLYETRGKTIWYVSKVKGDGGVDWEWTSIPEKATTVSFYWARRFMADRRACGVVTAATREVIPATSEDKRGRGQADY